MKIARNDACPCASGETFAQCHGGSRHELRASARRLHALAEVHDVAALFPFLRPVSSPVLAFAETAADELGEHNGWIPPQVVEEGLALVDDHERRRLVVAYASRYPDRWQSVCNEVGDAATAARVLAASAVRAAIGERRPPPRRVLLEVEREHAMLDTPAKVLAFLLSPGDVWSYEDALTAGEASAGRKRFGKEWTEAIDAVARSRLDQSHERRVRELSEHFAHRLPFRGLPRASGMLGMGCARLRRDPGLATELAVLLLETYLVRLTASQAGYITFEK